jgi:hypothetical protein
MLYFLEELPFRSIYVSILPKAFRMYILVEEMQHWTEPACIVRPFAKNIRRKITQNSIEADAEEGHERKKLKWKPVGR